MPDTTVHTMNFHMGPRFRDAALEPAEPLRLTVPAAASLGAAAEAGCRRDEALMADKLSLLSWAS
eukprot:5706504-Prymnesium_polylepis.1